MEIICLNVLTCIAYYFSRLGNLGINKEVNKTRLKSALLDHFKDAVQEQTDGKNVVFIFQNGMSTLMKEALKKTRFFGRCRNPC